MSFLNLNFSMIQIIHNMLILLKSDLNYLKNSIFECFLKEYNGLTFFIKTTTCNDGRFKS